MFDCLPASPVNLPYYPFLTDGGLGVYIKPATRQFSLWDGPVRNHEFAVVFIILEWILVFVITKPCFHAGKSYRGNIGHSIVGCVAGKFCQEIFSGKLLWKQIRATFLLTKGEGYKFARNQEVILRMKFVSYFSPGPYAIFRKKFWQIYPFWSSVSVVNGCRLRRPTDNW